MTQKTQGGIVRWVKAREEGKNNLPPISFSKQVIVRNIDTDEVKKCLNIGGVEGWADNDPNWLYYNTEWLDESPLPASPEGTWETEFEKLYAKKNYYNLVSFVQSIFQPLQQENNGYKEWHEDVQRICREVDVTLFGEEGASKQPSLCDIQKSVERLKQQLAEAREALEKLRPRPETSKATGFFTDRFEE